MKCINKESKWTTGIKYGKLNYKKIKSIVVKAFDKDVTENEFIGEGKIKIKDINAAPYTGEKQIELMTKENVLAAHVKFSYKVVNKN